MKSLEHELEKMRALTPIEVHLKLNQFVEKMQEKGIASGLQEGSRVRDFLLKDSIGNEVALYEELSKGPVVLTFYRGGWCPYCNRQLRAYQEVLPQIQALGGQLIAVSPQLPDYSLNQQEKDALNFKVLSDPSGITAVKYNLLYDVPQDIQEMYLSVNIDLKEYNGAGAWILPVPATFMIDENAIVRSSFVGSDFTRRKEPEEILWELRNL